MKQSKGCSTSAPRSSVAYHWTRARQTAHGRLQWKCGPMEHGVRRNTWKQITLQLVAISFHYPSMEILFVVNSVVCEQEKAERT